MIVLHIGISKTGSSAIQRDLLRYRGELSAAGIHYGGEDEGAASRAISSGNGVPLAKWLNPALRRHEADADLDFARYVSPGHPVSLISCEALSAAKPERLALFRDEVVAGQEVRIVAFVRDIYPHAVSSWMQNIKRAAYTGDFQRFCANKYGNKQCRALKNFTAAFGSARIDVIHYDSLQTDIFAATLTALDVAWRPPEPSVHLNRGLTAAEIAVLRQCNGVHKNSGLATVISDLLLERRPDKAPARIRAPEAAALLKARFGEDVAWVNQCFFAGRPTLAIGGDLPGEAECADETEAEAEVWPLVAEALSSHAMAQTEEARLRHAAHKLERQTWAAERAALLASKRNPWLAKTQAMARRLLPDS
jgi:hypothetical protein